MPIATDKICKQIRATPGMAIEIARTLGLHRSAVHQWRQVPANRAHAVSAILGLPVEQIRPDIFLPPRQNAKRAK